MDDTQIPDIPKIYPHLVARSEAIGFTMPSDLYIGTLLKTLITAKPGGLFLELGTGIGLSLSWMIEGLQAGGRLITVDNDRKLSDIALEYFGHDPRVEIVCADGAEWIRSYQGRPFDLVFADAWPGKYSELETLLDLIKPGGCYVIDDMQTHPNWPEGHAEKAKALIGALEKREDFQMTKMNWATGIIIAAKKS